GLDPRGHALADAVDLEQPLRVGSRLHQVHRGLLGGLGGAAEAADAKAVGAVDLHEIGGLVEEAGDGFVVHTNGCGRPSASSIGDEARFEPSSLFPSKVRLQTQLNAGCGVSERSLQLVRITPETVHGAEASATAAAVLSPPYLLESGA